MDGSHNVVPDEHGLEIVHRGHQRVKPFSAESHSCHLVIIHTGAHDEVDVEVFELGARHFPDVNKSIVAARGKHRLGGMAHKTIHLTRVGSELAKKFAIFCLKKFDASICKSDNEQVLTTVQQCCWSSWNFTDLEGSHEVVHGHPLAVVLCRHEDHSSGAGGDRKSAALGVRGQSHDRVAQAERESDLFRETRSATLDLNLEDSAIRSSNCNKLFSSLLDMANTAASEPHHVVYVFNAAVASTSCIVSLVDLYGEKSARSICVVDQADVHVAKHQEGLPFHFQEFYIGAVGRVSVEGESGINSIFTVVSQVFGPQVGQSATLVRVLHCCKCLSVFGCDVIRNQWRGLGHSHRAESLELLEGSAINHFLKKIL